MTRPVGRPLSHFRKWSAPAYDEVRLRSGISREEAGELAQEIHARLLATVSVKAIRSYGLDNPYMSEDARLCMVNEAMRLQRGVRQRTRSERAACGIYIRRRVTNWAAHGERVRAGLQPRVREMA